MWLVHFTGSGYSLNVSSFPFPDLKSPRLCLLSLAFQSSQPPVFLRIQLPSRGATVGQSTQFPTVPNKYTGPFHWRVLLLITLGETVAGWHGDNKWQPWERSLDHGSLRASLSFLKQDLRPLLQTKEPPSTGKAAPLAQKTKSKVVENWQATAVFSKQFIHNLENL